MLVIIATVNNVDTYIFQKYPNEGLTSVIKNMFDFGSYSNELHEILDDAETRDPFRGRPRQCPTCSGVSLYKLTFHHGLSYE